MVKVIVVNKAGQLKELNIKKLDREELYKKAGLKKPINFIKQTVWTVTLSETNIELELWAKTDGKAGYENKYDFPPPVDTTLYFGSCILLLCNSNNHTPEDLTIDKWKQIYNTLFGGFEDLNNENSEDSNDELDEIPQLFKTKEGYLKDEFICEDTMNSESENDMEDYISDDGDNSNLVENKILNRSQNIVYSDSEESDIELYDNSELVKETYIYSDDE